MLNELAYIIPGQEATLTNFEDVFYWGKVNQQVFANIIISASAIDSTNSPTSILRPGLPLGMITASKTFVAWDPTATDGSQNMAGIIIAEVSTAYAGSTAARVFALLVGGNLKVGNVLLPGNSSRGIAGDWREFAFRRAIAGRFIADDRNYVEYCNVPEGIVPHTAGDTLTTTDLGKLHTFTGATVARVITIPTPVLLGRLDFFNDTALNHSIAPASAGQMKALGMSLGSLLLNPSQGCTLIGNGSTAWLGTRSDKTSTP
jgi:hypothetical protein